MSKQKANRKKVPNRKNGPKAWAAKARRMRELELPRPSKIKLDSKEFNKLQAKWYAKLAKEGFEDLEWSDASTGKGQNSGYLKKSPPKFDADKAAASELYYALLRNFITHDILRDMQDRMMLSLHAEGVGYREILEELKQRYKIDYSLTVLHHKLKALQSRAMEWNKTSQNGLYVTRAENSAMMDKFFEERFAGIGESSNLEQKSLDIDDEV